jgi:hypothetical protein
MDWIVIAVQWLHVLLGIMWFGNALVVAAILIPTLNRFPIALQREVGGRYGERAVRILDVVIPTVILLGVVRGTLLGPIDSFEQMVTTAYGITWLVALVLGIGMYWWSKFVINPAIAAMNSIPLNADGTASPAMEAATDRVKRVVILELLGFFAIFTCMILMRFGL